MSLTAILINQMLYEILKEVTEGKFLNRSLLFHIEDTLAKKHFEAVLNKVTSKTFNLR